MKLQLSVYALLLSISVYAQSPLAEWNFNGNTNDITGHGWDAINHGCTLTAGKAGQANTAYRFNGTGDHMTVLPNTQMNIRKWTIMALIKPLGLYNGLCQYNMIVERGLFYTPNQYSLFYGDHVYDNDCNTFHPDKVVFAAQAAGNNPVNFNNNNIVDTSGVWYCVAATYGNDTMKIYLNGNFIVSGYYPNQYGADSVDSLRIGYGTKPWITPNWFNGVMDHLAIYDTMLNLEQLNTLCTHAQDDTIPASESVKGLHYYRLSISPDPATDFVDINASGPSGVDKEVYVSNLIGQTLRHERFTDNNKRLDIANLPKGLYIIRLLVEERTYYAKLLKD